MQCRLHRNILRLASIFTPRAPRSYRSERLVYDISVRSMNIDDRPTTILRANSHSLENFIWPCSATRYRINFVFRSRVGFSGTADRTA